jgi:NAD(P)H-dependent FMN reductase
MSAVKILAFAGSLRAASYNKQLARLAADAARAVGAEVTLIDLRDFPMPLYDGDLERDEGLPGHAKRLRALFKAHDGFLIACPEYNAGMPAVLKNAIDWVSRKDGDEAGSVAFEGRLAALCGATPGQFAALRAMEATRQVLINLGCNVLSRRLGVPRAHEAFDPTGALRDPALTAGLETLTSDLVRMAGRLRVP